jgi:hypothetical protein
VTDFAALVSALYRRLGTWQRVAEACNDGRLHHSRGYYQQIASGRIQQPSEAARAGITSASESHERLLTCDVSKDTRKTVHISDACFTAGNLERKRLGLTWPEMVASWRKDATNGELDERRDDAG